MGEKQERRAAVATGEGGAAAVSFEEQGPINVLALVSDSHCDGYFDDFISLCDRELASSQRYVELVFSPCDRAFQDEMRRG